MAAVRLNVPEPAMVIVLAAAPPMMPAKVVLLLTVSVLGADRVVEPLKLMALPLSVPVLAETGHRDHGR